MGARREGDRRGSTGLQHFDSQTRLPNPRITLQEHTSEFAGHCAVPLGLEIGDLVIPSNDPGLPRRTAAAVEAHLDLIRSRGSLCSTRTMPNAGPLPGGRYRFPSTARNPKGFSQWYAVKAICLKRLTTQP
jgi:hypothetical protein